VVEVLGLDQELAGVPIAGLTGEGRLLVCVMAGCTSVRVSQLVAVRRATRQEAGCISTVVMSAGLLKSSGSRVTSTPSKNNFTLLKFTAVLKSFDGKAGPLRLWHALAAGVAVLREAKAVFTFAGFRSRKQHEQSKSPERFEITRPELFVALVGLTPPCRTCPGA